MNFHQILQSSSMLSRLCYHRFVPFVTRFGSTLSKETSSDKSKSTKKGKSGSEYLAADMYDYNPFSHYDMETAIIKYRLPQPSSFDPLKPDPPPPKK